MDDSQGSEECPEAPGARSDRVYGVFEMPSAKRLRLPYEARHLNLRFSSLCQ
jgi:hypothetical protein